MRLKPTNTKVGAPPPPPGVRFNGVRFACLLCILAILLLAAFLKKQNHSNSRPASAAAKSNLPAEALAEKIAQIEEGERARDQTIWKNEIIAQQHEELAVQLWDAIKDASDKWRALSEVEFNELILPDVAQEKILQHAVKVTEFRSRKKLATQDWKSLITHWSELGIQMEQCEFRHTRFDPPTPEQKARSTFSLIAHANQSPALRKFIISGDVKLEWENPAKISRIDASTLRLTERTGVIPFRETFSSDISPPPGSYFVDPLLVQDLDADGNPEIVLANKNQVWRRNANGQYQSGILCLHPPKTAFTALFANFNRDSRVDYLCADAEGLLLYLANVKGELDSPPLRVWRSPRRLMHPQVLTAGDVDGDGDLDLWLAQYKTPYLTGQMPQPFHDANDGFPSSLLINQGNNEFLDETEKKGLGQYRFRRTYSSSFIDFDNDHDLDLLVVSDFAGVDLYRNDGRGQMEQVNALLGERHLLGMAHAFGDLNGDGQVDFLAVGMNSPVADRLQAFNLNPPSDQEFLPMLGRVATGNRLYLSGSGKFENKVGMRDLDRTGWSWGAAFFDWDNDGDLDIYLVNGHESNRTVRDYEPHFWCHDIFIGNSQSDPAVNAYFKSVNQRLRGGGFSYGGYEKNRLLLNVENSFIESGYLFGVGQELDCRNLVSDDLNGDGRLDLAILTFEVWPQRRQRLIVLENQLPKGHNSNWIGFRLQPVGAGYSVSGARVEILTSGEKQNRWLVTGDSYRSQSSGTAHFGLGAGEAVKEAIVHWPNGTRQTIPSPAINRYHAVTPLQRLNPP